MILIGLLLLLKYKSKDMPCLCLKLQTNFLITAQNDHVIYYLSSYSFTYRIYRHL